MSDIMRGQASQQTTATEQAIKARFASVRVQSMQDEFARFCSDTQRIKAEIISKHFEPQTIIERSNIMRTPDAQFAEQAVQLIKDKFSEYRITVNPDSVSLTDFAA
jgi:stress-induced morphogen